MTHQEYTGAVDLLDLRVFEDQWTLSVHLQRESESASPRESGEREGLSDKCSVCGPQTLITSPKNTQL